MAFDGEVGKNRGTRTRANVCASGSIPANYLKSSGFSGQDSSDEASAVSGQRSAKTVTTLTPAATSEVPAHDRAFPGVRLSSGGLLYRGRACPESAPARWWHIPALLAVFAMAITLLTAVAA